MVYEKFEIMWEKMYEQMRGVYKDHGHLLSLFRPAASKLHSPGGCSISEGYMPKAR